MFELHCSNDRIELNYTSLITLMFLLSYTDGKGNLPPQQVNDHSRNTENSADHEMVDPGR